jgi:hypothetical protein
VLDPILGICMHKNIRIPIPNHELEFASTVAGLTGQATRLKLLIPMRSHPESPDQSILLEANLILVFLGVEKLGLRVLVCTWRNTSWPAVPSLRDLCRNQQNSFAWS